MEKPGARGGRVDAPKTVLIVEDDEESRRIYKLVLERAGYAVLLAQNAAEGLATATAKKPDLVISDVQMPGEDDGFALCEKLRRRPRTADVPILLMSGMNKKEQDQLEGLDLGADDYLIKPFSFQYLVAKVKSVLRRYAAPEALEKILVAHRLTLDVAARTATGKDGRPIKLTRKEFDLLTNFLERPGRVLSPQFLLESVWGYDLAEYNDPHTVTVHLSSLRRKLGPELGRRIVTVAGAGYRFDAAAKTVRARGR